MLNIKYPWFAVFLSRILLGLGQFYWQDAILGGLFLGLTIIFSFADDFLPILSVVTGAIAAFDTAGAYIAFPRKHNAKCNRFLVLSMAIAVLIWGIFKSSPPRKDFLRQGSDRFCRTNRESYGRISQSQ